MGLQDLADCLLEIVLLLGVDPLLDVADAGQRDDGDVGFFAAILQFLDAAGGDIDEIAAVEQAGLVAQIGRGGARRGGGGLAHGDEQMVFVAAQAIGGEGDIEPALIRPDHADEFFLDTAGIEDLLQCLADFRHVRGGDQLAERAAHQGIARLAEKGARGTRGENDVEVAIQLEQQVGPGERQRNVAVTLRLDRIILGLWLRHRLPLRHRL